MASSPITAIRKPVAEPPFRTMTTSVIYRKVASKRQLKYDAVKAMFTLVMIEAMEQAKHRGTFDLASWLRFKMDTIHCWGNPPKRIVKTMPLRKMRRNLKTMP